uniref:C2H2-type domain-containing protein n=1 Tax=Picea sitchensis TaxID=3332 RepID=B8LRQ3_PICSI|nr:unknown [Picea sitchensis]
MSNITSASGEASVSSGNTIAMADKERARQPPPNQFSTPSSADGAGNISTAQQNPVKKRKRNLPGNPDPDAEVIALSPRTLMATNRFICEVCSKGFQRDQNLQLHRRGHNLPWKLKQRTSSEMRKRVYICPESTCVHHDPTRALGDLTGIKKHFCRKHGEKKWKCDRCSKRYAVQSDWKAHSKTCGTREYRCDCGTLFSRRDSFITHRAFCDALAEDSTRISEGLSRLPQVAPSSSPGKSDVPSPNDRVPSHLAEGPVRSGHSLQFLGHEDKSTSTQQASNPIEHIHPSGFTYGTKTMQLGPVGLAGHEYESQLRRNPHVFPMPMSTTSTNSGSMYSSIYSSRFHGMNTATFGGDLSPGNDVNSDGNTSYHSTPSMSATALLQKAAQMGATASNAPLLSALRMAGSGLHSAWPSRREGLIASNLKDQFQSFRPMDNDISANNSLRSQYSFSESSIQQRSSENPGHLHESSIDPRLQPFTPSGLYITENHMQPDTFGGQFMDPCTSFGGNGHPRKNMGESQLQGRIPMIDNRWGNLNLEVGGDKLTRDFLGVGEVAGGIPRALSVRDIHVNGRPQFASGKDHLNSYINDIKYPTDSPNSHGGKAQSPQKSWDVS